MKRKQSLLFRLDIFSAQPARLWIAYTSLKAGWCRYIHLTGVEKHYPKEFRLNLNIGSFCLNSGAANRDPNAL